MFRRSGYRFSDRTCVTQESTAISDRICNQIRFNSVGNGCGVCLAGNLCRYCALAMGADTARRIAEAGTEQPVEVRDIGKADVQRDVGYPAGAVARLGQQRESPLQPQLVY